MYFMQVEVLLILKINGGRLWPESLQQLTDGLLDSCDSGNGRLILPFVNSMDMYIWHRCMYVDTVCTL